MTDTPAKWVFDPETCDTPAWSEWKGEGPAPAYWYATNPETKELIKVYRSYEDYIDD